MSAVGGGSTWALRLGAGHDASGRTARGETEQQTRICGGTRVALAFPRTCEGQSPALPACMGHKEAPSRGCEGDRGPGRLRPDLEGSVSRHSPNLRSDGSPAVGVVLRLRGRRFGRTLTTSLSTAVATLTTSPDANPWASIRPSASASVSVIRFRDEATTSASRRRCGVGPGHVPRTPVLGPGARPGGIESGDGQLGPARRFAPLAIR